MKKLLVIFFALVVSAHAVNHTVISLTDGTITWGATVNGNRVASWGFAGGGGGWNNPYADNLVFSYSMQATNPVFADASGLGNDGIGNDLGWNDETEGVISNSYNFDPNSSYSREPYVVCSNSPTIDIESGFTAGAWVYSDDAGNIVLWNIGGTGAGDQTNRAFHFYTVSGLCYFYVWDARAAANSYLFRYQGPMWSITNWHMITCTYTGAAPLRVDFDGVEQTAGWNNTSSGTFTQTWNNLDKEVRLGWTSYQNTIDGAVSGAWISEVMSTQQVWDVAQAGRTNVEALPVNAYVDYRAALQEATPMMVDNSGEGHHCYGQRFTQAPFKVETWGTAQYWSGSPPNRVGRWDGVDDEVIGPASITNALEGLTEYTFMAWNNIDTCDAVNESIFGNNPNIRKEQSNDRWYISIATTGGSWSFYSTFDPVSCVFSNWQHVALTVTANGGGTGYALLYTNGYLDVSNSHAVFNSPITFTAPMRFGWQSGTPVYRYHGRLVDVEAYDRALTAAEILDIVSNTESNTLRVPIYEWGD